MSGSPPLLHMEGICKRFGATKALRHVDFEVWPGQVMALIGENGAGKSTLMKAISGALAVDQGRMLIEGRPYEPRCPSAARLAGIAMIYQELNLAPDLSVEDNIMLGQEAGRWGLLERRRQRPRVQQVLRLLGHGDLRPETPVRDLPIGAQQLVEIARALVQEARLLIFDEPTSSLSQQDARHLFRVIRRLRDRGIGIVYISHFLEEVREVCDYYTILRDGQTVESGELACVREDQIVSMMVGRSVAELFPTVPHRVGEPILDVRQLSGRVLPCDVSFAVHRGEILGIAGLVGAGRTELLRALLALDPVRCGQVRIRQVSVLPVVAHRIAAGMGMVSEDRKGEGLAQNLSIADNLTASRLEPYQLWGILNLRARRQAVADWLDRLEVKSVSPEQEVRTLSGGNQQKIALARVMHQDADILLLDEPTRGIDVGTKASIYRLVGELAASGKAVVFVSSYLPELLAVCDRIGVMVRGRLREIRPAAQWTEEEVMARATGVADDGGRPE